MTAYLILTILVLWALGGVSAFMILVEICEQELDAALPLAIIWPFLAVFLIGVALCQAIINTANKIKAWWKAPIPQEPEIDPEEG